MAAIYLDESRATKFTVDIQPDRRNPDLRVLTTKGFVTIGLTFTKDQLKQIGSAIEAETGGSPF